MNKKFFAKVDTKKYFVTRYANTGNVRRRVKYQTKYQIFGITVFVKTTAVKKAANQKNCDLQNGARQMALAYQASIQ